MVFVKNLIFLENKNFRQKTTTKIFDKNITFLSKTEIFDTKKQNFLFKTKNFVKKLR